MRTLAILLLLAGCAEPAQQLAATAPPPEPLPPAVVAGPAAAELPPRPIRLTRTLNVPLAPVASPRGMELAPLPNRDIEAPSSYPIDALAPTLEPMLMPQDRRFGVTFGREHLRETGPDRPFDSFIPGARIVIPLEPTAPAR
jgi:hypothetical protein